MPKTTKAANSDDWLDKPTRSIFLTEYENAYAHFCVDKKKRNRAVQREAFGPADLLPYLVQEHERWEQLDPETFTLERKGIKECDESLKKTIVDNSVWATIVTENTGRTDYRTALEDKQTEAAPRKTPRRKTAAKKKADAKDDKEESKSETVGSHVSATRSEVSYSAKSESVISHSDELDSSNSESEGYEPKYKRFKSAVKEYARCKLHWENANESLKESVSTLPFAEYMLFSLPGQLPIAKFHFNRV